MHRGKKQISHVYVDAAGDPGLNRSPDSSRAYIVAAMGIASRDAIEAAMDELRTRAGVADGIELHHRKLRRGLAAAVYRDLALVPFSALVVVARKADHAGRWRRPNDLVIDLAARAIVGLVQHYGSADITVVLDAQRAEVAIARSLRKAITDQLRATQSNRLVACRVVMHDSARNPGLELADLVAGAAFRLIERGQDDDWRAISQRCWLIEL